MEFEWNPRKAESNFRKHKVSFAEAATVFRDSLSVAAADPDHSLEENRYFIVGTSNRSRFLIVSFAERSDRVRIISARELTRSERKAYEEENQK